jgi:hypothetical protein
VLTDKALREGKNLVSGIGILLNISVSLQFILQTETHLV